MSTDAYISLCIVSLGNDNDNNNDYGNNIVDGNTAILVKSTDALMIVISIDAFSLYITIMHNNHWNALAM